MPLSSSALTSLEDVDNSGLSGDLAPLAQLTNLESLRLAGTLVHDLSPLIDLTYLRDVDLSNASVSAAAIEQLGEAILDCKAA
jgi:Leucine-rich repeat (LRR) protein